MDHFFIPEHVKQRAQDLIQQIEHQDQAYYQNQTSLISDAQYDALRDELEQLEGLYPGLITDKSPSRRVGHDPSPLFSSVPHLWPIYSLDKVNNFQGFLAFSQKIERFLGLSPGQKNGPEFPWVAEPKIDGLTVILRYKQGVLVRAATRGNGVMGEDVTPNVRTITQIPHILSHYDGPDLLEVRGEVYILRDDFNQWNTERQAQGLPLLSNPRNAAAGSLRHIDPLVTASRPLCFTPHGSTLSDDPYPGIGTYQAMMQRLTQWGLPPQPLMRLCPHLESVAGYFAFMTDQRPLLPYEIDGVVYKIDNLMDQKRLGHSSRAPRYAVAEKFPAHDALTTITGIEVQVGRTGVITPVAHVQAVLVGGVMVTRASMHNANELQRKDARVMDRVLIRRAGDVIPQIVRVMDEHRGPDSIPFVFPTQCPSCQGPLSRKEGAVAWRCTAASACPSQAIWRLRHYVSRDAMDIVGLGVRQLTLLYEKNLVRTPADLFRLTQTDLMNLDGWGKKSATQAVQAIAARRETSLHRWIYALGIPCVGYITARALADHYKNRANWAYAANQACIPESLAAPELCTISGIGQDILQEIIHFTQTQHDWVQDLSQFVTITERAASSEPMGESWPLYNKTVVFTGTLPNMTRAEAKERAEQCGARVLSGLSPRVDFLVSGEKSGKKIDQARSWQISILNPDQWVAILAQCQNLPTPQNAP